MFPAEILLIVCRHGPDGKALHSELRCATNQVWTPGTRRPEGEVVAVHLQQHPQAVPTRPCVMCTAFYKRLLPELVQVVGEVAAERWSGSDAPEPVSRSSSVCKYRKLVCAGKKPAKCADALSFAVILTRLIVYR